MKFVKYLAPILWIGAVLYSTLAFAADPEAPGVPNFHRVDDHVYRGGQPTADGWSSLSRLGIRTIIDLREHSEHSTSAEAHLVESFGMQYVSVPMAGMKAPAKVDVLSILNRLDSKHEWPVFVHCRRGADRTGTVFACYRIAHDGWSNGNALQEARSYGMSRLEFGMRHFIQSFHIDGLTSSPSPTLSGDHP